MRRDAATRHHERRPETEVRRVTQRGPDGGVCSHENRKPRLLLQLSHIEMNVSSWTEFARHIPFCSRPGRIHAPAACDGSLPARPNFPHSLRRASGVEDGDPSQGCPRRSRLQECAACVFKHPGVAFSRRRSPSHELSVRGGICRFCKP
jgi:hypothetical protein